MRVENKYGFVELKIGEYRNVREIHSKDLDSSYFFDIATAEQITLITEDSRVQLSSSIHRGRMFMVHHKDVSTAAVCKVLGMEFLPGVSAREQIERDNFMRAAYGGLGV